MTDSSNPYAPPRAAVADVFTADAECQPVKIFGASGRIGRLRYFAYMLGANFILSVSMLALMLGIGLAATRGTGAVTALGIIGAMLLGLLFLLSLIFYILTGIQRSHDMNLSGWAVLLTFIPLAVLVWLFVPGTQGANRYGPPPAPNSTGVKVIVWIAVVLSALSVVAMLIGA